jgi:hypothetical protein
MHSQLLLSSHHITYQSRSARYVSITDMTNDESAKRSIAAAAYRHGAVPVE